MYSSRTGRFARPLDDSNFWTPHQLAALAAADIRTTYLAIPPSEGLVSAAGPGVVPQQDRLGWISAGVETFDTPSDAGMAIAQINGHSALELSRVGDRAYFAAEPFMTTAGLVVVTSDTPTFDDAVNFWNARALRPSRSHAVSVLMSEGTLGDRMVQRALVEALKRTSSTSPSAVVYSWSMPKPRLEALVEAVEGLTAFVGNKFSEYHGRRPSSSVTFSTQVDVRSFWLSRRDTGIRNTVDVLVERPRTTLRMRAPMVPHSSMWGANPIVVELTGPFLRGPKRSGVASLYLHAASWRDQSIAFHTHLFREWEFALVVPTSKELLQAAIGNNAVVEPNDKARQLAGVLSVGGAPDLYASSEFLAVVQSLTPVPRRDIEARLRRLASTHRDDPRLLELAATSRTPLRTSGDIVSTVRDGSGGGLSSAGVKMVLTELVARGLARRGFRARCNLCDLVELREVSTSDVTADCSGCGAIARFHERAGEPEFFYALSSLMQRLSLNGGLAPLAAYVQIIDQGGYVIPGVNITTGSGPSDVDLLGFAGDHVFAGESKMSRRLFTKTQLLKDVDVSKRLGVDEHFVVCPEPLSNYQTTALKRACRTAGLRLRTLVGDELFRPLN